MTDRQLFFRTFATLHPRSYWMMQGAIFYGLMSLLDDVTSSLGWGATTHWAPRLLSAIFFGGFMLMMAQRDPSRLPPRDAGPKV
jgi:hypothetical protein